MIRNDVYVSVKRTSGGKADPVIVATVFAIGGIIFFILGIVIPSVMVNTAKPAVCAPTEWLHRDEQTICRPKEKTRYIAKTDSGVSKYVKYYRLKKDDLSRVVNRRHVWNGTLDLSKGAFSFPVTSSAGVTMYLTVKCSKGKCDTARIYWLYQEYFDKANKSGTFNEDMYSYRQKDLTNPVTLTEKLDTAVLYYVVISNLGQDAIVDYKLTIDYSVYNVDPVDLVKCNSDQCQFDDVATNEVIIMEYLDPDEKGPACIGAEIKSEGKGYGGAVFFGILFMLLSLACFAVMVMFILHKMGKLDLYKKKAAVASDDNTGSYEAPDAKVSAGGDVNDAIL